VLAYHENLSLIINNSGEPTLLPCNILENIEALRVSSSNHEPNMRSLPQSWGGHEFNSLYPLGVRLHNQGQRFTSSANHGSWGSTRRVFRKVFLGKKKIGEHRRQEMEFYSNSSRENSCKDVIHVVEEIIGV
jgi:hypothetical protein